MGVTTLLEWRMERREQDCPRSPATKMRRDLVQVLEVQVQEPWPPPCPIMVLVTTLPIPSPASLTLSWTNWPHGNLSLTPCTWRHGCRHPWSMAASTWPGWWSRYRRSSPRCGSAPRMQRRSSSIWNTWQSLSVIKMIFLLKVITSKLKNIWHHQKYLKYSIWYFYCKVTTSK